MSLPPCIDNLAVGSSELTASRAASVEVDTQLPLWANIMSLHLGLSADDLNADLLQELTRQLCIDLRDEAGLESGLAETGSTTGTRGDLEIIGQIMIKAVGAGGAIVALINVLKVYAQRKPSLQFEFQNKSGRKLKIKADDLRSDDMTKLLETIKPLIEE